MIQRITKLYKEFFQSESSSALILFIVTLLSLCIANSPIGNSYVSFWHDYNLEPWINDGLMTFFFLLIGLEIKRELYCGELSNFKNALLPVAAAIGGMLVPALIHFAFNSGTHTQSGMGIPVATDIAFSLAVLLLLGNRIPFSLKIFLTALAIIDDLGAVIVIALFYSTHFSLAYLCAALALFGILLLLNRFKVHSLLPYLLLAIPMWYCMLYSGIHPTICGVLIAFSIPFQNGDQEAPSQRLQQMLHKPVAYGILPLFALANTAVIVHAPFLDALITRNSLGIILGLVLGKPIGIVLASLGSIKLGFASYPNKTTLRDIVGAGLVAGIGFTMSIFITLLAFDDSLLIEQSKLAILVASAIAGVVGYFFLKANKYQNKEHLPIPEKR